MRQPRTPRKPRWYFSFRSPYSWLAYRDLVRHHPTLLESMEWMPFWEPDEESHRLLTEAGGDFPYVPMSRAKHLYILQDVRRLARDRGLAMTWPVDRSPRWEVAHLPYLLAHDAGLGPQYVAAVYRARWEHGRDICDPATIGDIAGELGLPAGDLARAVDDQEVRRRGTDALLSISRDGVFGVPFFVRGHDKYWGLDRLASFAAHAPGQWDGDSPQHPPHGGSQPLSADQGHTGGCG